MIRSLALLLLFAALAAPAAETIHPFESPRQEARYEQLTERLRCLVCQAQNIAESNAPLAKDMRDKVFELLAAGRSDREIVEFMVSRYGDFVLYRPPVEPRTWLLWFGPFVLVAFGVAVLLVMIRRRRAAARPDGLNEDERRRLATLLADEGKGERR